MAAKGFIELVGMEERRLFKFRRRGLLAAQPQGNLSRLYKLKYKLRRRRGTSGAPWAWHAALRP
jgi:hypothetical protein